MNISLTKPYFGAEERRAVTEPLDMGWVIQGPKVAETGGEGLRPRASAGRGRVKLRPLRPRSGGERTHAPTQSRQGALKAGKMPVVEWV